MAERVGFEHFGRSMRISMLPILQGTSFPHNPLRSPYFPPDLPPALFPHLIRHRILADNAERPLAIQSHQKYHQSLSISTAANALKV